MAIKAPRALGIASLVALTASLAACGPDDRVNSPDHYSMLDNGYEWPMDTFGFGDAGNPGGEALPPMPSAQPMVYAPGREPASYASGYGYAPRYYDDYYDDSRDYYAPQPSSYYADDAGTDTFSYLALAALLGGVLADSPPDYAFDYGGVQPWAWRTGDRYVRYAEPIRSGYRYYYYEPGAARPFLVRDPYYSYGYRGSDLAVIYDRNGRVLDRDRLRNQRRVATRYYDRGVDLHRAAQSRRHRGVAAPLWTRQRGAIVNDQRNWERARSSREGWRNWTRVHEPAVETRWAQEQAARTYAAQRFDQWRSRDYRGTAPRFYREASKSSRVRKAVLARQQAALRQQQVRAERRAESARGVPAVVRRETDRPTAQSSRPQDRRTLQRRAQQQRQVREASQRRALHRTPVRQASQRREQLRAETRSISQRQAQARHVSQRRPQQQAQVRQVSQRRAQQHEQARQVSQRRAQQSAQARQVSQRRAQQQAQARQVSQRRAQQSAQARQASQRRAQQQAQARQASQRRAQQSAQARQVSQRRAQQQAQARQASQRRAQQQTQARQVPQRREQRQAQARQSARRSADMRRGIDRRIATRDN
ncbi:hypothetical protein B2G71_02550 [Novosphingobium sp. PC22D]|uniref:hypothetical protein n=1 Tax=Novosphingobium sp. PC22D TaxID=1962403 RepID=UPI000BEF22AD|nr:hypothetical protein [Novosphingobium sp. PC22D]PEQ14482.1 hypothetical protein B2G71_02550 [Novosphingobium sp. PC22D]